MDWQQFHFLRPLWWFALIPLALLVIFAWRARVQQKAWQKVCDPSLMQALLLGGGAKQRRWPLTLLALGWLICVTALAGPTWQRLPSPAFQSSTATVFVLNLDRSMNAADVSPTRIGRARFELQDAIQKTAGDQLGLVIFSDEPYVVTPLADDPQVLLDTVSVLATDLMPAPGARVDRAVEQAVDLLRQAGVVNGRILFMTDSVGDDQARALAAAKEAQRQGYPVSVLAFGTTDGAPVPRSDGRGFVQEKQGKPLIARVDEASLKAFARSGGGQFAFSVADDRDLDLLLPVQDEHEMELQQEQAFAAGFDTWNDVGAWLLWIPLVFALMAFRKEGESTAAMALLCLPLWQAPQIEPAPSSMPVAETVQKIPWTQRAFERPDRIAQRSFDAQQYVQAAATFEDAAWKASALYRAGDFETAAEVFAQLPGVEAAYNRGNALARAGQLKEAIAAYDQALEMQPDHEDARFNRDLVQKLLDEQQQEQQDEQSQEQQEDEQNQDQKGQQDQQSQDQQSEKGGDPQQQDQQNQDEQSQDQQSQDQQDDQQDDEQQQDTSQSSESQPQPQSQPEEEAAAEPQAFSEKDQATEQWLNAIPTDPGGLLREKLRRRHARNRYQNP